MKIASIIKMDIWLMGWCAGVCGVVLLSLLPHLGPPGKAYHLDKFFHMLVYAFLSFIPLVRLSRRKLAFVLAGLMAPLGFLLEYLQNYSAGREFCIEDMIANNIGALAGIAVGVLVRAYMHNLRSEGDKK